MRYMFIDWTCRESLKKSTQEIKTGLFLESRSAKLRIRTRVKVIFHRPFRVFKFCTICVYCFHKRIKHTFTSVCSTQHSHINLKLTLEWGRQKGIMTLSPTQTHCAWEGSWEPAKRCHLPRARQLKKSWAGNWSQICLTSQTKASYNTLQLAMVQGPPVPSSEGSTLWTRTGRNPSVPTHTTWDKLNMHSPLESNLLNLAFLQLGKERPRITKQVPPPPCVSDGILMPT